MEKRMRYLLSLILFLPLSAVCQMADVAPVPKNPAASLTLPAGFKVQVFADLVAAGYSESARFMAFGPDGNLYLAMSNDGKVVMLPDANRDGLADKVVLVADKLNAPNAVTFVNGVLYVSNQDGIVKLERKGEWPAVSIQPVVKGLPTGGHTLKTVRLGPDGYLYLNVGSSCNVCVETDPLRATMLRYTPDGVAAGALTTVGKHAPTPVWATGLRNAQGFAWHPVTGAMYATNNGADMRSGIKGGKVNDELPPEHLNQIMPGEQYGWPYCWGNRFADPNFSGPSGFCEAMQAPALTFTSHATPLGITFLDRAAFPTGYQHDAIVALHGSWNRDTLSGYKVVRVKFEQDKPVASEDFITGWLSGRSAWGRPVDVQVGPDGALYISDDRAGLIYRVSYTK